MQMSTKPHYFRIGVFVIVATVLIVIAVTLFGAGLFARNEMRFESYFAESITGLTVGAALELRGVRIGQVESIGFVDNAYELPKEKGSLSRYTSYVRVVSAVSRSKLPASTSGQIETALSEMIARGLRIRITSNILTGQAYLEMNYLDPNRYPVEPVPWAPKYLVIPSAPSEFTTIKDSIDRILVELQSIDVGGLAKSLDQVLTSLDQVIREAGVAELSMDARALLQEGRSKLEALEMDKINGAAQEFLASLNSAVADANIPQLSRQARDVLTNANQKVSALDVERINADVERLLTSLDRAVADANVPGLSQEAQTLLADLRSTNKYLKDLLRPPEAITSRPNVPEVIAHLDQTITELNRMITSDRPQISATLTQFQQIADSLNELVTTLKEQPSSLLFGRPPRQSEVLK
jgi:paraquat-inducible protein B